MNKVVIIPALLLSLSGGLVAQAPVKPKPLAPSTAQADARPVTRSEAKAVFARMEKLMSRGLNLTTPPTKVGVSDSSAPVTRPEVVREFNRMFQLYEPKFKFTPPKVKFDASQLTLSDHAERPALEKLIAWGTVARLGPIASGSGPTLTVHQFGDAVGFFMARVADLAHLPPSKWTPYLNGGRS